MASMLAPLKPREANSSIAAVRMRARFASGALGLRIAARTRAARPLRWISSTLQGKFNRARQDNLTATRAMTIAEHLPEPSNPLGIDGIEFIEYATAQPQALGAVLQKMGFQPVARHRSREVLLYRQGTMNLIVNAHGVKRSRRPELQGDRAARARRRPGLRRTRSTWAPGRCRRAPRPWSSTSPASTASATACIYFVDRYRDFSIYDVDFVLDAQRQPHAAGARRPALLRRGAEHLRRPHARLGRLLPPPVRLLGAARGRVLRRAAQGHAAREPVPQVLPAADRAAAGRGRHPLGGSAGAHRPRRARRAGGGAALQGRAASCSSTAARCSRARRAR